MAMALKRVRTPHYINGFGEGRINVYDRQRGSSGQQQQHQHDATGRKNIRGRTVGGGPAAAANRQRGGGVGGVDHDERLAAQEHPALVMSPAAWRLAFDDSEDVSSAEDGAVYQYGIPHHRGSSRGGVGGGVDRYDDEDDGTEGPWQLGTLGLLVSVVLLSALFLHIISDAQKSHLKLHHRNRKRRTASLKTPRKKKTDEWSGDDNGGNDNNLHQALLTNDSGRGGGVGGSHSSTTADTGADHSGVAGTNSTNAPAKPLYYPYHTPGHHHQTGLQQHRHRKMTSTTTGGGDQQQQQQPQQQQTAFHQRNYYLNQSGGAVVAPSLSSSHGGGASTSIVPRSSVANAAAASPVVTTPVATANYDSNNNPAVLPVPLGTPLMPHLVNRSSAENTPAGGGLRPIIGAAVAIGSAPQQPRMSSLYPQPLSSASSFDSSVEHNNNSINNNHHQQKKHQHRHRRNPSDSSEDSSSLHTSRIVGSATTTPMRSKGVIAKSSFSTAAHSPKGDNSPSVNVNLRQTFHSQKQPSSHLLLSPGTDDVKGTISVSSPRSRGSRRSDIVEQTPRAGNLRSTKTIKVGGGGGGTQAPTPDRYDSISVSSETFKFASPPSRARIPESNQDGGGRSECDTDSVPFIPSLDVHVAPDNATPRPLSVNLDDLHLYQMLESGNVSHWEARVAEESRLLQQRSREAAALNPPASGADTMETASSIESSEQAPSDPNSEIPSNDPRKSILHKRSDLTISTDAAASLQGAIAFSEIRLVEVIGGGGFGQVWKAVWRSTPVAVKVLTGSAQSKNVPKAVLEEFVAEINLLKGMRHPNICLYMGACLDPPNRAIITELAANGSCWDALRLPLMPPYKACDGITRDGWPLNMYLPDSRHGAPPVTPGGAGPASLPSSSRLPPGMPPRGTWPWHLVKRVACGAARGMAYLHSGKPPVLHRDLKSANILLDESYTAKVCDFGLSRLKSQGRSMTGNCGTVQWMAPEVLANMSYNEKADVYSFGIICWELLSRQCPFDGMTAIQCALAVLNRNQRPEIPKWCPPSLHALIRACIKKDPDERPSFEQVLLALDSVP